MRGQPGADRLVLCGRVRVANADEAIADHISGTSFGAKNQKVVPSETLADYKATGFNTVVPDAAGVAPTVGEIRTEMEGAGTKLTLALEDTDVKEGEDAYVERRGGYESIKN